MSLNALGPCEVLNTLQSDFISGDSTVNHFIDISIISFYKAIDESKEVCAVFCDISKAFNRV